MDDINLILDFISVEEEAEILSHLQETPIKKITNRNSIKRYGSPDPYRSNVVSSTIPDFLNRISQKIYDKNLLDVVPNSVTINEYQAGQGITPHIDSKKSGPIITVLSLLSPATMVFTLRKDIMQEIELLPRSLIQMSGDARNIWQHSVNPVSSTRYSIVFRCA